MKNSFYKGTRSYRTQDDAPNEPDYGLNALYPNRMLLDSNANNEQSNNYTYPQYAGYNGYTVNSQGEPVFYYTSSHGAMPYTTNTSWCKTTQHSNPGGYIQYVQPGTCYTVKPKCVPITRKHTQVINKPNTHYSSDDDIYYNYSGESGGLIKAVASKFVSEYDITSERYAEIGYTVKLHTLNPYTAKQVAEIQQRVADTIKIFESNFNTVKKSPETGDTIDIYMFDRQGLFKNAMNLAGTPNSVGLTWGANNTAFVLADSNDRGMKVMTHELGHILFSKATNDAFAYMDGNNSNDGHKILNEGISEFLANATCSPNCASAGIRASARMLKNFLDQNPHLANINSLDQIMSHGYVGDADTVKYHLGHLLVKYMQDRSPGTIGRALERAATSSAQHRYGAADHTMALKGIKPFPSDFLSWVDGILNHSIDPYENLKNVENADVFVTDTGSNNEEESDGMYQEAKTQNHKNFSHNVKHNYGHNTKSDDAYNHHLGKTMPVTNTATEFKSGGSHDKSDGKSWILTHGDIGYKLSAAKEVTIEKEVASVSTQHQGSVAAGTMKHQVQDNSRKMGEDGHGHGEPVSNNGFTDVEKDFGEVHRVTSNILSKMNIVLDLHSVKPLSPRVMKHAERIINKTLRVFEKEFGEMPESSTPRKLNIYLFKNKSLLGDALESVGADRDAGGMAWPNLGKIYVSQLGKIRFENLSHEIAHQLVDYATGGMRDGVLGTSMMKEGIAEYVQQVVRNGGSKTNFELSYVTDKVLKAYSNAPDLEGSKSVTEISELINSSKDPAYSNLEYSMGSAIVRHLQTTKPGLLKSVFKDAVSGKHDTDAAKSVDAISPEFNTWLRDNSSSKFIEKHELLTVSPVHSIGYKDSIINGEISRVESFTARLVNNANQEVAQLNPVAHVVYMGRMRAYNPNTDDYVNLDNRYNNLKLIDTVDGQKYVYSSAVGEEYFLSGSDSSVASIGKIMAKYDGGFTPIYDAIQQLDIISANYSVNSSEQEMRQLSAVVNNAVSLLKSAARDFNDSIIHSLLNRDYQVSGASVSKTTKSIDNIRVAYSRYVTEKAKMLLETKDVGDAPEALLSRVLKSLIFIDPESIIAREGNKFTDLPVGTILSVKGTGKADSSGVSVYKENVKVGELSSNVEEFVQYVDTNGQQVSSFIVSDALKTVYTKYNSSPIIVVTKDENGDKVANFLKGTKSGTLEDSEIEVEVNQFLDLHSKGLQSREGFPLSKGIKIATYDKNYHNLEKGQPSIEKGDATDDRGTDRVSDDRYSATIKVDNKVLVEKMSSVQFYITEPRQDSSGKQVDGSDFVIYDIANDRHIQFPESITHLKLVRTDTGIVRLVPSTSDGNTNPDDMPQNAEAYAYIDPIYAYNRLESNGVASHDQFELIDFNKYATGTLFSIRFDANDPRIPKTENGSILRINDQSYLSRVGIYAPNGEKIGELSSAATFFQGDVFISFDQSYSQSDFVSSLYRQEAEVKDVGGGLKKVALSGEGDLGTDSGFSNYYSFYHREKQDDAKTVQKVIDAARDNNVSHRGTTEISASALDSDVSQHSTLIRSAVTPVDDLSDIFEHYANPDQSSAHTHVEHNSTPQHSDDSGNGFLGM